MHIGATPYMTIDTPPIGRSVVFISKATPGDDEFTLWLAPRLEAAGYTVFADILWLEPGSRWRKEITDTLQDHAAKMLLCCRDSTLSSTNVQEEIGIAEDLAKSLNDPKFIIPLRLEPFKKLLGIGELQYIDFVRGWADGLDKLLAALRRQNVPRDNSKIRINPNWEIYRRRSAVSTKDVPERLTSNWLRTIEVPDVIRYFEPTGAVDIFAMSSACNGFRYPAETVQHGFFSFVALNEVNKSFISTGKFSTSYEINLQKFMDEGLAEREIRSREASNIVQSMFRQAWNTMCRDRGLLEYAYSKDAGFHASKDQLKIGQKIAWGKQGDRRSSMLRNIARGYVWQFGVTALPSFWPYPHFKLKSRVLFAPLNGKEAGDVIDDKLKQHRLRRSVCKGWRNKQWHGRMMAFLELLSGESPYIRLPLGENTYIKLDASPILFTSPISTDLPDEKSDEQEEEDISTLTIRTVDEES